MKRLSLFMLTIIALGALYGCQNSENQTPAQIMANRSDNSAAPTDDGKLTNAKAQNALTRWVSSGQVTVQGIQEFTKENAAKADINFTNFSYKSNEGLGESQKNYSGPATAIFTHYNDGCWMLSKITIERGFLDSVSWNNLNVEVR